MLQSFALALLSLPVLPWLRAEKEEPPAQDPGDFTVTNSP